jgi:hypothetical protein
MASNGNGSMKSGSWVVLECLVLLLAFGIAGFFVKPAYELGVGIIIGAVINTLSNALGVKSGALAGKMPEQATDSRPGQTTKTQTEISTVTVPVPPVDAPPTITEEVKS